MYKIVKPSQLQGGTQGYKPFITLSKKQGIYFTSSVVKNLGLSPGDRVQFVYFENEWSFFKTTEKDSWRFVKISRAGLTIRSFPLIKMILETTKHSMGVSYYITETSQEINKFPVIKLETKIPVRKIRNYKK